jgi:hypothetical protein
MGSTATTAVVAPTGIGAEVKAFFSKLGKEIEEMGSDIQKVISATSKEIPAIEPVLNATLQQIFPSVVIPAEVVEKVISVALNAASQVASALESQGLSPTADQVAAVAVAGVVHSLNVVPTAATKAVPSA